MRTTAQQFRDACYGDNTEYDLLSALSQPVVDTDDCEQWEITPEEWRWACSSALTLKYKNRMEKTLPRMRLRNLADVREAALRDAVTFAREFPGETLEGDWDSETWSVYEVAPAFYDNAWETYRTGLRALIARLALKRQATLAP